MIGKGGNLRHPVYILDFCKGVEQAMRNGAAIGEIFLIAGEQTVTTSELIESYSAVMGLQKPIVKIPLWCGLLIANLSEVLFKTLNKEPPISRRTLEFFDTNNAFKIDKARNFLNYKPQFSFKQGLDHCKEWLEGNTK
jgi:nucleoside-diphosphate-sugar epimerase